MSYRYYETCDNTTISSKSIEIPRVFNGLNLTAAKKSDWTGSGVADINFLKDPKSAQVS